MKCARDPWKQLVALALATATSDYTYYADGVGLDSPAGIAVSKPGGGTYHVNVQACLSKLAVGERV